MKRMFLSVAILFVAGTRPAWAQQSEIAALRAEVAKQQAVIEQLLQRLQALEAKQPPPPPAGQHSGPPGRDQGAGRFGQLAARDRQQQSESERLLQLQVRREDSDEPMAFQQHHLGVIMAKQLGSSTS